MPTHVPDRARVAPPQPAGPAEHERGGVVADATAPGPTVSSTVSSTVGATSARSYSGRPTTNTAIVGAGSAAGHATTLRRS